VGEPGENCRSSSSQISPTGSSRRAGENCFWLNRRESNRDAVHLLMQAIEFDPNLASDYFLGASPKSAAVQEI